MPSPSVSSHRPRAVAGLVAGALLVAAAVVASGPADARRAVAPGTTSEAAAIPGPLTHTGRWITDAEGRVVMGHGVNFVAKQDGVTPAAMGFGDDDAALLAANGFDTIRLGLTAGSIMPSPGVIDTAYLDSFQQTVDQLTSHGLQVLVDLHQDGWGHSLGDDGFPAWMTFTGGAENTHTTFPLYYITNPAIQAAFDSFWANHDDGTGTGLQDRVATMFSALAQRFAGNPGVLGYDLINEPWPGTTWNPCLDGAGGCPVQDQALDGYYAKATAGIRSQDADHLVLGEPYVLFNFGQAGTNIGLPGGDASSGMSFHLYTTDPSFDPDVLGYAQAWSDRTGGALLNTEFGAITDTAAIDHMVDEFDAARIPWMWWAYNEGLGDGLAAPLDPSNPTDSVAGTLVRPHARVLTGVPASSDYDISGRILRSSYTTARADGGSFADGVESVFQVAPRTYPTGYSVKVTGGTVTSEPNAAQLTIANDPGAAEVTVKIWPADQPEPPDAPPTTAPPTTAPPPSSAVDTTATPTTASPTTAVDTGPVDTSTGGTSTGGTDSTSTSYSSSTPATAVESQPTYTG